MRGSLPKQKALKIEGSIPDINSLYEEIIGRDPSFVELIHGHESKMGIAWVCLQDCMRYLREAWFALYESLANMHYWKEGRTAIFYERFYSDDVTLRLYSSAEHLSRFLKIFLQIPDDRLKRYRKNRISLAIAVGKYCTKEKVKHPISGILKNLIENVHWNFVCEYRNKWVHDQRPRLKETGITFARKERWQKRGENYVLKFGGGDTPELSIEELINHCRKAYIAFVNAVRGIYDYYTSTLPKAPNGTILASGIKKTKVSG